MTVGASSSAGATTESLSTPSPAATRTTFPQSAKPVVPAAAPQPQPTPPKTDPVDFVVMEAVRISQRDASARSGASEMLRWTSRRRTVIEQARDRLQTGDELDVATRAQALALVEQALAVGLLF